MHRFGPDIWIKSGPEIIAALGFHYPTRMVVMRLPDGGLFIWSPVALSPALQEEINTLGTVRHLVAPNHLHHVFIGDWHVAYPNALLHAPPGLRAKRPDLRIDHDLGDTPHPGWADAIDQVVVIGNAITTEVVFFHKQSQTVLFADLLQHLPPGWYRGWRALIAKLDGMQGPEPAVPRKFRMAFRDKAAAKAAVKMIKGWPTKGVIIAHGDPVTHNGAGLIARAFNWLDRS